MRATRVSRRCYALFRPAHSAGPSPTTAVGNLAAKAYEGLPLQEYDRAR